MIAVPERRPRLLVANFFPAGVPARSGGEQRYYYLYRHLSEHFDVTLLSPTYHDHAAELVEHSAHLREHRVPKDPRSDTLHWTLGQAGIGPECSAYVVALAGAWENALAQKFSELAGAADLIIHESPYTVPYDRGLGRDGKPRIYNSYNVEYKLAEQMLRGEPGRKAARFIRELEQHLVRNSVAVFATSREECDTFIDEFELAAEQVHLVPNGFEAVADAAAAATRREDDLAVFLGSAHPPNIEAVQFIADELAPKFPLLAFKIIGSVCRAIVTKLPANVELLGFIDEAAKQALLARCTVALNPLFTGAGTNLKMFDYMASSAPIACTPVGARGIGLESGRDALICSAEEFPAALRGLLDDKSARLAMGEAAAERAYGEFTWKHIAQEAAAILSRILDKARAQASVRRERRQLLVLNDFPVANASGGGQVRIAQLARELGREFEVLLLCLGEHDGELTLAPGVVQRTIAKTAAHRAEEQRASHGQHVSVNDVLAAGFCRDNPAFVAAANAALSSAALVVFEHPYLAPMLGLVPEGMPVVYSSLNVEMDLKAGLLTRRADHGRWLADTVRLEREMLARANLVITVSEADRRRFEQLHPSTHCIVVENGVRSDAWKSTERLRLLAGDDAPATAVFLGSAHPPNVDAAKFIIEQLAPALPDVAFLIVGTVCDALDRSAHPDNALLLGLLDENEKNLLLASATVAVNPMFDGGGSSLKIPDFFAAGLPVVSSEVGMRGYRVVDGEHFLLAQAEEFPRKLRSVLDDGQLRARLSANARRFAQGQLDWQVLGGKYRRALRSLLPARARKRVLAATYRVGDPPPGGAEAFLANALRELAQHHPVDVDVAACAVGAIADHLHFSAIYHDGCTQAATPEFLHDRFLFPVDAQTPAVFEQCRRLHALWMEESRAIGRRLATTPDRPLLMGGWNFAERQSDGSLLRWASGCSQILLSEGVIGLMLEGVAPGPCPISVSLDGAALVEATVEGDFQLGLAVGPGLLELRAPVGAFAAHDPRELAFAVRAVTLQSDAGAIALELGEDQETVLRQLDPQRWIDELIIQASARDSADDSLFTEVRGPRSGAFSNWLQAHVADYDLVVAQGVPFATCPLVVDAARREGIPVIALPHFHMEDRYYHWQSFYDAFRRADVVIAAPTQSAPMFFERIGANAVALPGGGLDPAEFSEEAVARGRLAFRALHASSKPFVLVLGRKAAGKHYTMVVDAVRALRAKGRDLDLVLIGPDDDGRPLARADAIYYGAQARDVVIGALAEAMCLVNMSDSESFGIVLLEAWMAGTPVIARRRCLAFAELVEHGANGYLADDVAGVVTALGGYLDSEPLRQRHAAQGRDRAGAYSWRALADALAGLIERTVAG